MTGNNIDIGYIKLSIDECFKNHYVVPDYQREYVWTDKEIEQMFTDIEASYASNPDKPYFMGMTVVYGGNSALELIDGQQRITTFFILLCAMIHILEDNKETAQTYKTRIFSPIMDDDGTERDAFSLELQYSNSTDCLSNIFHGNLPSDVEQEKLSDSDKRLYDAYVVIKKHLLNSFTEFDELKKFGAYLFKRVQFVQIEAKDISDALKIFETINERGVGLSPMDLLKNMIFMQVSRDDFKDLNDKWKSIVEKIQSIKEKPLRFLRYYITASYDIADSYGIIKGILPEDDIYSWLMQNDNQCHYKKNPFGFVASLEDGINRYIKNVSPNQTDKGNQSLLNINRIAGSSYKSHLVLLLSAVNMDDEALAKFKRILESVIFYSTVNKVKGNETEKIFANWCPKIRLIKNEILLNSFVEEEVIPQVDKWKNERNYHLNFNSLNLKTTQQYRIRYILARISKYVDDVRSGGNNYADISNCFDNQYQIEHIMPQKCMCPGDYDVTDEEFVYVDNLLGNLTLLEKSFNQSCQNADYNAKCNIYSKSSLYITKSLPALENIGKNTAANALNTKLKSWDKWSKNTIIERQEIMYKLSEEIWDIRKIVKDNNSSA